MESQPVLSVAKKGWRHIQKRLFWGFKWQEGTAAQRGLGKALGSCRVACAKAGQRPKRAERTKAPRTSKVEMRGR